MCWICHESTQAQISPRSPCHRQLLLMESDLICGILRHQLSHHSVNYCWTIKSSITGSAKMTRVSMMFVMWYFPQVWSFPSSLRMQGIGDSRDGITPFRPDWLPWHGINSMDILNCQRIPSAHSALSGQQEALSCRICSPWLVRRKWIRHLKSSPFMNSWK